MEQQQQRATGSAEAVASQPLPVSTTAGSGDVATRVAGDVSAINSVDGTDCDESAVSMEKPAQKPAAAAPTSVVEGGNESGATGAKRAHGDDKEENADGNDEEGLPARKRQVTDQRDGVQCTGTSSSSSSASAGEGIIPDSSDDAEMEEAAATFELAEFHRTMKVGQPADVYDARSKKWLAAKIVRLDDSTCEVHFLGWSTAANEVYEKHRWSQIVPKGSEARDQWDQHDAKILKRRQDRAAKLNAAIAIHDNGSSHEMVAEPPSFVEAGQTRSGRKLTKRLLNDWQPRAPAKPASRKKKENGTPEHALRGVPEEDMCGICGEIEDEEMSDMLLCDGGCLKSYHFSCLGIDATPAGEKWLCEQCRTNEQKCFGCGRNGTIGSKGGVFRCSVASCGKFFHQRCIDTDKLSRRPRKPKTVKDDEGVEHEMYEFDAPFRCPRHVCSVCENTRKSSDMMCCLKCPESYHPYCVPPSARYNTVGLFCSKHPEDVLPLIPSFYVDPVTVDLNLHLPMLFLPKTEPAADDIEDHHHFRLPVAFLDSVKKQPPSFRTLQRNLYTFKPPKVSLEDSPMCTCTTFCGDDCINRVSFTECFGPAITPGMKIDKNTKESNCRLGDECGNRALHQKIYPKFKLFHTIDKGWALRVEEPVRAGRLVIEYIGEVINEEEKERRLQHHAKFTPEDKNMYIMELGKGEYIDARFKGSVSRFINHSCDPNCHLVKWKVEGIDRIAITALRDIEQGEELSYDYQFHTKQAMEWRCHCKSKKCRGTMAPERINQADGPTSPVKKLTKKEKMKKLKRAMIQEKIQQDRESKSAARRLSLTAQVSLGDRSVVNKAIVRTGPIQRELEWAKYSRVFLSRNARRGFDFLRRKELNDRKVKSSKLKLSHGSATSSRSVSPARTDLGSGEQP